MIRGCQIEDCQRSPAKKRACCGWKLCELHELAHDCPRAAELLAMDKASAKAFLSREDSLTTAVVDALNKLPEIECAWQAKKRGKVASDLAPGIPDVLAFARGGATLIGVETKNSHKEGCGCGSCVAQESFAARLVAAGGVFVGDVRVVQQAIDGVRLGLARARSKLAG